MNLSFELFDILFHVSVLHLFDLNSGSVQTGSFSNGECFPKLLKADASEGPVLEEN